MMCGMLGCSWNQDLTSCAALCGIGFELESHLSYSLFEHLSISTCYQWENQ
ncbi:hypothetical protein HanPSC8_Chr16g0734731 [Helianthus annuus]|nr:hypothetical protein HanPSC8_Chr16g0734731 [Helianthus annuus]